MGDQDPTWEEATLRLSSLLKNMGVSAVVYAAKQIIQLSTMA